MRPPPSAPTALQRAARQWSTASLETTAHRALADTAREVRRTMRERGQQVPRNLDELAAKRRGKRGAHALAQMVRDMVSAGYTLDAIDAAVLQWGRVVHRAVERGGAA